MVKLTEHSFKAVGGVLDRSPVKTFPETIGTDRIREISPQEAQETFSLLREVPTTAEGRMIITLNTGTYTVGCLLLIPQEEAERLIEAFENNHPEQDIILGRLPDDKERCLVGLDVRKIETDH